MTEEERRNAEKWLFDQPLDKDKHPRAVTLDRVIEHRHDTQRRWADYKEWSKRATIGFAAITALYQLAKGQGWL